MGLFTIPQVLDSMSKMSNPPIKLTPLHSFFQQCNVQLIEHQGWKTPQVYTTREAELEAAQQRVAIADVSSNGKIMVQGDRAHSFLAVVLGLPVVSINAGALVMDARIYRLRNDIFFISTLPGKEEIIKENLVTATQESDQFITITDVTHGRSEIMVIGPNSQELLSKLCGLDFHPSVFPNMAAKQSGFAKTTQLIIRRDIVGLAAFSIIGARSLGEYLWHTVIEAGCEWDITLIGQSALNTLQEQSSK